MFQKNTEEEKSMLFSFVSLRILILKRWPTLMCPMKMSEFYNKMSGLFRKTEWRKLGIHFAMA